MRRILFVIESLAEYRLLGQLDSLRKKLAETKFDIHLVSLTDAWPNTNDGPDSWMLHSLGPTRFQFEKYHRLRKLVDQLKPDIAHAWGKNCHIATHVACIGMNTSRVFSHFEHEAGKSILHRLLPALLRSNSDKHVYTHASLLDSHLNSNQRIIPNTISREKNSHNRERLIRQLGLPEKDVFLVATVSRLEPKYRVKDLIWAMDLLCCVRRDIHLTIFGLGDWEPLHRYLDKTEAGGNVHFLDLNADTFEEFKGVDFYWNAQREQPIPSAMLDCMANRIPVISVLDEETQDLIQPMQTGLATNFGARDEFARWTKYLIEQPESGRKLAQQAQAHVENLFATEKMVDNYLSIYNEG